MTVFTSALLTLRHKLQPALESLEVKRLKKRLEKARDERDQADELRQSAEEQLEECRRNAYTDSKQAREHKSQLEMLKQQLAARVMHANLQTQAESTQNLKAYHESEKAREALQAQVEDLTRQLEAGLSNAQVAQMVERAYICTRSERAVLEAMGKVPWSWVRWMSKSALSWHVEEFRELGQAELNNRSAKGLREDPPGT